MSKFWAGFGVASLVWVGAGAYLHFVAGFGPAEPPPAEEIASAAPEPEPAAEAPAEPGRRRARRPRRGGPGPQEEATTPTGVATTGDDLREDEMRVVDMEGGGEQQLTSGQIEAGFDQGMGRIRRCLVLMAGSDPVTGRLTFGLRVAPNGTVRAVQLTGPAAATTGEAGDCLRGAARALRFDTFDGPEMVVRYPITLE